MTCWTAFYCVCGTNISMNHPWGKLDAVCEKVISDPFGNCKQKNGNFNARAQETSTQLTEYVLHLHRPRLCFRMIYLAFDIYWTVFRWSPSNQCELEQFDNSSITSSACHWFFDEHNMVQTHGSQQLCKTCSFNGSPAGIYKKNIYTR